MSRAPPPRWARPPARTPCRASRRSCRSWALPRRRRGRRHCGATPMPRSPRLARRRPAPGRARRLDRVAPAMKFPLLELIDDPAALRKLDRAALPQLARDLRAFVLTSVAQTGGHLSSNLGTIELTIALHYTFNTPHDRIVWDVGHQTYAHKILTGRRQMMSRLRMADGPSGFPRRIESRVRHVRHRAFVDVDLGGARHGHRRAAQGRGARGGRGDRRRGDERRDGLRGAQQCRHRRRRHAGDPQRQRHVDLGAGGGVQQPPRAPAVRPRLQLHPARRQGNALPAAAGAGARQALGRAHEGHGPSRHAVRGVRLQLHRADRRPRSRYAHQDARECPRAEGAAAAARRHPQGLRLRARRGRPHSLPRRPEVRPGRRRHRQAADQARVYAGVRRLALRPRGARPARRRDHAGDARRLRTRPLFAGIPRPLFRRRHRRAARGDVRRRPRLRRPEAGGRDLLDLPAARLRPADPRRRAAESARGLRHRSRGHRRRRRRDPRRRIRSVVTCAACRT